jgi:8-oxo-dGTP diphosphatase
VNRRKTSGPPIFEFSAGGVVLHEGKVLVIRARNLRGNFVWTFPKGKLNPSEKSPEAAIREVQEETGWRCRIDRELQRTQYWFQREGSRVRKTVRWFQMSVVEQVGHPDSEVEEAVWLSVEETRGRLSYESDKRLLEAVLGESHLGTQS